MQVVSLARALDKMFRPCDMDETLRAQTAEKGKDVLGSFITAP
jgi:hypothetical protein